LISIPPTALWAASGAGIKAGRQARPHGPDCGEDVGTFALWKRAHAGRPGIARASRVRGRWASTTPGWPHPRSG